MVKSKSFRISLLWGLTLSLLFLLTGSITAQVLSDGDVGNPNVNSTLGTMVNTVGDISTISGGTRPGGGQNLFHSFGQFDVPSDHIALFENSAGHPMTNNIFGRINSGNPSSIFGTVDTATNFPTASLWLMNPAGFVFGPNAALNVGGSFFVNNADSIKFADGKAFTALPSAEDAFLSVEPAVALSFLGPRPNSEGIHFTGSNLAVTGSIDAGGNLTPGTGMISVVGRDGDNAKGIKVTGGRLTSNFGQINMASVASGGELDINTLEENPKNNGQSFTQLGQIELSQAAQVTAAAGGEQAVVIRAGVLTLEGGSRVNSVSTPLGNGNVTIHADSVSAKDFTVVFDGLQFIPQPSGVFTFSLGGSKSGDVLINASSVELDNFGAIGTPSFSFQGSNPAGGNIVFEVDNLTASNQGEINSSTTTSATAGYITIRGRAGENSAAQAVAFSSGATIRANTFSDGDGGNITIDTARLTITGVDTGAEDANSPNTGISTDSSGQFLGPNFFPATGDAGDITITASEKVTLSTQAGILSRTTGTGLGSGGTVTINTNQLDVDDRSSVTTSTNSIWAQGKAGDVRVQGLGGQGSQAQEVNITDRSTIQANTFGAAGGGDIEVQAKSITMNTQGNIQAATFGNGDSGDITAHLDTLDMNSGSISAGSGSLNQETDVVTAGTGAGGNITIQASTNASLSNGALIQADTAAQGGASLGPGAGTITIHTPDLDIQAAEIRSQTISDRAAGNIIVEADTVSVNAGRINANSGFMNPESKVVHVGEGKAGDIAIQGRGEENSAAQSVDILNLGTIQARTIGDGAGGNITIHVDTLNMNNGGSISAGSGSLNQETDVVTAGTGAGGNITIQAATNASLSNGALIEADTTARGESSLGPGAGTININTPELQVSLAEIRSQTISDRAAGNIVVDADTVSVDILGRINANSGLINSNVVHAGEGKAGDITIRGRGGEDSAAQRIDIFNLGTIQSSTIGDGDGGMLSVTAKELTIKGINTGVAQPNTGITADSGIVVDPNTNTIIAGQGRPGLIDVDAAGSIVLSDSATIQAINFGTGEGRPLEIEADQLQASNNSFVRTSTGGQGTSGDLTVTVHKDLTLSGGSQIQSATAGNGNAGTMTISTQDLTVTGIGSAGEGFASGFFVNAQSPGTDAQAGELNLTVTDSLTISDGGGIFGITTTKGEGAKISVTAGTVTLKSGGAIATSTFGSGDNAGDSGSVTVNATSGPVKISGTLDTNRPIEPFRKGFTKSGIFSNASVDPDPDTTTGLAPNGNAGAISVSTPDSIILTNQGEISTSAEGKGKGGTITLTAGKNAEFTTDSKVSSLNKGTGDAGGITVEAGDTILVEESSFNVQSAQGNAGDIKFDAEFMIRVRNSVISGSTGGGPATQGANINFDPQWIIIEKSRILANAFEGKGGSVTLTATNGVLIDPFTTIDFSSTFGTSGSLDVQAPIQNLSGAIAPLPEEIVDLATLVGQHCAAQKGGQLSSFVEAGRDVVPPGPVDFLTSPLFLKPVQHGNSHGTKKGVTNLTAQQLGMVLERELQITHLLRMADSSRSSPCLL